MSNAGIIFGTAVVAVAFMSVLNNPVVHDPATEVTSNGQKELLVQADQYTSHYTLENKINKPFLIAGVLPNKDRSNHHVDFYSHFITFSPEASRSYLETYPGTRRCPAQFLNKHAEYISLYAATPEISETLSTWKQKGSIVSTWAVMNITGQCIGTRTKLEKNGEDITEANRHLSGHSIFPNRGSDCEKIYVTDIRSADISVEAFMEGGS